MNIKYVFSLKGTDGVKLEDYFHDDSSNILEIYQSKIIIPNTIYCIISPINPGDVTEKISITALDMAAKMREVYPIFEIDGFNPNQMPSDFLSGIDITTNRGSYVTTLDDKNIYFSEAGTATMHDIWVKGINRLFNFLTLAELAYSKEKNVKHKAWIHTLKNPVQVNSLKRKLALEMGHKPHQTWEVCM